MLHLNGHVIAAVDVETTGLTPGFHDLIQIAVVPLDEDFRPMKGVAPFYADMLPTRPQNVDMRGMSVNGRTLQEIMKTAATAARMGDLFSEWFAKLPLGQGRQLVPLAHNYTFDKEFIISWLGRRHYENFFHPHFRDLLTSAVSANDVSAYHLQKVPYPKLSLSYMCNILGVENMNAHDALGDALATAAAYREYLRRSTWTPVSENQKAVDACKLMLEALGDCDLPDLGEKFLAARALMEGAL